MTDSWIIKNSDGSQDKLNWDDKTILRGEIRLLL